MLAMCVQDCTQCGSKKPDCFGQFLEDVKIYEVRNCERCPCEQLCKEFTNKS
jgi:hypothetical protein